MLCVSLNDPKFKQQAARNDVSESNLELMIHKYRIQTGQEDAFPSDDYIQEQLGNVMYEEPSDNVIKLWRQDYYHPGVYKTMEELNEARDKALQFFPASSIVYYKDNNGNFVLNIKEPVKDLSTQNTSYRYSNEMWQIKQRAIANGTFMKAPNGEKSNLKTERQWLQVRTQNFRDWFGDWLTYQKIKNATVIWGHPGTGKTYLHNQGRKDIIDFDSEYKSRLGNLKEREELKRRIGKQAYNARLDELFDEARQEAINSGRKLLVSDMHFLRDRSNDLDVITNISDEEFIERSHQRGEHDEADKQEWKNSINKALVNISSDKIINTTGYISDLLDGTNVSKVVDENGEPKVVYHHTDSEPFTVFDLSRTGQNWSQSLDYGREAAFFLSYEQKEMKDWGNRAMPVFLNIRNPEESSISSIGRKEYFTPSKDADGLVPLVGYDGWQNELHILTRKYENYPNRNARKEIFKKSLTYLGQGFENWGQEYVVFSPNQIKSATDNIGTFSKKNDSILKRILTPTEYQDMIDELSLSEDNISAFLYNFVTKVLNTNPRYKVDETSDDFAYKSLQNSDVKQFGESLLKKIFGYEVGTIGGSRKDFINTVNNLLDSWSSRLMDIVNNPPMQSTLASMYNKRSSIRNQINLLQKSLDRAYLTDAEKTELTALASRLRVDLENRRAVGFKIQKLKSDIRTTEKAIRKANFQNYAMLLAAKNRLVAINTIPNLKDLVKKRLIAEYDSRTINKDTKQKLESKRQLFDAIQKVIRSSSLSEKNTALFNETEQRETSYNEVFDKIIEQVPEAKGLLSLFQVANPNLRLFVGGSPEESATGTVAGGFSPRQNTLRLSNIADVYTAIHELAHAATYYGIVGQTKEIQPFENQINQFMDYIRDYVKREQMDPSLFVTSRAMRTTFQASVYGFTNASEFIAETFGNPAFQELLSQIPAMQPKKFKSLLHQIWSTVVDFLNNLAGRRKLEKTALDQAKTLGYAAMAFQQQHIQKVYDLLNESNSRSDEDNTQRMVKRDSQVEFDNNFNTPSFEYIDNAILTGNWTDEALDQLDNLINEYNNGRNEITQILGRGLSEGSRGSEAYAAASIIARRVQSSVQKSNGTISPVEEFRARNRERRLKENAIQQWAQENGWWWNDFAEGQFLDDYLVSEYDEKIAEGSESIVHLSKDGKHVIKAMSAIASDGDIIPLLQKIELHNQIFTNTPLDILGFGRTKDGNFRIIVQQPFI